MIISDPDLPKGTRVSALTEFVDIYPTLSQLAGIPQAPGMEGTSFAPLLDDPQRAWKKAAYTIVSRGQNRFGLSVRTDRYRYTEWNNAKDGVELYDHEIDVNEWTNLAGNAKAATQQRDLAKLLHADISLNLPPKL